MGVQRLGSIGWQNTESENKTLGRNSKQSERRIDDKRQRNFGERKNGS